MCGIIGVINKDKPAAYDCIFGLDSLQHRGKEMAGIVTECGAETFANYGLGKIQQIFLPSRKWDKELCGTIGMGHTRYSTSSRGDLSNAQPARGFFNGEVFDLAHNGNLVNVAELKKLTGHEEDEDDISDTYLISELLSQSSALTMEDALLEVLPLLQGAFCLLIRYRGKLYAVRDRFGFHPLQIGRRDSDWLVASESCVFPHLEGDLAREVGPGELIVLDRDGIDVRKWIESPGLKFDIFEFIYFLRPDSMVYGIRVEMARRRMGWYLAHEHPLDLDKVIGIPGSGTSAAFGYCEGLQSLGIPAKFDPNILIRPHTHRTERTFIGPDEKDRLYTIRLKFSMNPELLAEVEHLGKVDDSTVRGATNKRTNALLREGASRHGNNRLKIYGLNSSPPYMWPDFYGIDTYRQKGELILSRLNGDLEAAAKEMGLDYLGYLSLESTIQAVLDVAPPSCPLTKESFYTGPFTGEYPAGTGDFEI